MVGDNVTGFHQRASYVGLALQFGQQVWQCTQVLQAGMAQQHSLDGVCLQLEGCEQLSVKGIRPPAVKEQGDAVDLQYVA